MSGGDDEERGQRITRPSAVSAPRLRPGAGGDEGDAPSSSRPSAYPIPLVRDAAALDAAKGQADGAPPLLQVRELSVALSTEGGAVRALEGVSFDVPRGRTVALVGESGCGKTVTALSILGLLPEGVATVRSGTIELEGRDLLSLGERELRAVRGGKVAMVFQEPMTSLDPVYTVGAQIAEAIRLHRRMSRWSARLHAITLLRKVGLPEPEVHVDSYPHELSGGMRQRAMIAMALAAGPSLLIADEPITALDTTTQAQILDLLSRLKKEASMSLLLIAHDLALVGEVADEIVVLYAGVVVERGPARRVLASPEHPYTRALLRSAPSKGFRPHRALGEKARRLPTIAGGLPDLRRPLEGCRFHDRCERAFGRCREQMPALVEVLPGLGTHASRCFLSSPDAAGREGAA